VPLFVADVCPDFVSVSLVGFPVVWDPESPVSEGEAELSVFEGAWVFCGAAERGVSSWHA